MYINDNLQEESLNILEAIIEYTNKGDRGNALYFLSIFKNKLGNKQEFTTYLFYIEGFVLETFNEDDLSLNLLIMHHKQI